MNFISRTATTLLMVIFFFLSLSVQGQENTNLDGFGMEANLFVGKVLKHEAKFELPIPNRSTGLDLNFQWKTFGKKEWQQRRRYPTFGIGVTYTDYGNDSIYGRCFSIYPNIVIPLITGSRVEWTMRIGDGLGYVTRDYSRTPYFDTINNAIGSHVNDYFSFLSDIRFHVSNHWDVQAGVNFSHISDASFHQPNLGINLPGFHVGIRYFPSTSRPAKVKRQLKPLSNRWLVELRGTMGLSESSAPFGPSYPIYLGTAYVSHRYAAGRNKLLLGVDYSYSEQIADNLRLNGFAPPGQTYWYAYKTAAFVGNEFLVGHVGIVMQMAWYLHQESDIQNKFYEKLGLNLYLMKREHGPVKELFLCAFMEAHLAVAEFSEFGIGMGF